MSQKRHPPGDDRLSESGGDEEEESSRDDKRQKVPALQGVVMQVMQNHTIHKLLLAMEPVIRKVVKEEIELAFANHFAKIARCNDSEIISCSSTCLQLQFMTTLSLPIFTGSKIEGEGSSFITIGLVNASSGQVVTSGEVSLLKVELVVLEGDFEGGTDDSWTAQEFNGNIVKEREGKRSLLLGDVFVVLNRGTGTVGEIAFTDNSSWTRSRKFKLGARIEDGCFNGIRVREAITESFVVKDHRGELYKKHYPPQLDDEVWRLEKIGKDGAFHKRLNNENINTVKDFLTLLSLNPLKLRNMLGSGMSTKMWDVTVEHARTCVMSNQVHIFHPEGHRKTGIVFNVIGQVIGAISTEGFHSFDYLDEKAKDEAQAAVNSAYDQWDKVLTCDAAALTTYPSISVDVRQAIRGSEYRAISDHQADAVTSGQLSIPTPDIFPVADQHMEDCFDLDTRIDTSQDNYGAVQVGDKIMSSMTAYVQSGMSEFLEQCMGYPDHPDMSCDTSDISSALRGFLEPVLTSSKRACKAWRTVSSVLGWIFYTKRVVAQKKGKLKNRLC